MDVRKTRQMSLPLPHSGWRTACQGPPLRPLLQPSIKTLGGSVRRCAPWTGLELPVAKASSQCMARLHLLDGSRPRRLPLTLGPPLPRRLPL